MFSEYIKALNDAEKYYEQKEVNLDVESPSLNEIRRVTTWMVNMKKLADQHN